MNNVDSARPLSGLLYSLIGECSSEQQSALITRNRQYSFM